MKKLLLSIFALFAMANVMMAEDIIWAEDFSSYKADDVPTGGAFSYACENGGGTTKIYEANLAGGTSPELLVAKTNGSFTAVVPLNGKSGDMFLSFKTNQTIKVELTGATLGEATKSGNAYVYPVTVAAGTESVTIKLISSTSKNARLDDIKLYQGEGKKPAGLSWGTSAREVTLGASDNNFPTLTNGNELAVTYTSDNTEVATVDANGVVTIVAEGKAVISAIFEGNDNYEAQTVTYTLTVKPAAVDVNTAETPFTVAQAHEFITKGEGLSNAVYVKGIISKIDEVSTQYGNATYYISDDGTEEGQLQIYRGYSLDGAKFTAADEIKVGDQVIVNGKLVNYNGTHEFSTGSKIVSLNGTTAISNVTINNAKGTAYNLAGQRVSKMSKGINIINGKKVIF